MGYDENFLGGDPVPLPTLSPRLIPSAWNGGAPIEHTRFSIIFNSERGLAICTAHTIDGETLMPEAHIERDDRFRFDPEVDRDLQIDNDRGYRSNPWDRGHLVRRRSVHWGDESEARQADSESYFWTNIAPQHERLHDTAWGPIEDWMLARAESDRLRAAVFTGPVMTPDDPVHQNGPDENPIQIPAGFWKVIVVPHRGVRTLAAFLVWQRDHDSVRPVTFAPFLEQVRLTTIEFLTGLSFTELRQLDPQRFGERTRAFGPPGTPRSGSLNAVTGPSDIAL
ncbi:MAG: DNA/RNA non-specific endonuclease [Acidimicrobiia bacterium]|nr:DNA/RNA non-specific endonuclease [Acidimicrobiia bacterium]